jgi:hypothetical protein
MFRNNIVEFCRSDTITCLSICNPFVLSLERDFAEFVCRKPLEWRLGHLYQTICLKCLSQFIAFEWRRIVLIDICGGREYSLAKPLQLKDAT